MGKLLGCSRRQGVACTGLNWPKTVVGTEELEEESGRPGGVLWGGGRGRMKKGRWRFIEHGQGEVKARHYCELIAGIEDSNGSEERAWSSRGLKTMSWLCGVVIVVVIITRVAPDAALGRR